MRVISGTYRGRRLEAPAWPGLRPTSDRVRETLFNILAPRIGGSRVLDGCAGTGAIGIEAMSRGAVHVTFVDRDRRAVDLIARNLARCGIVEGFAIIHADLEHAAAHVPHRGYDLILLDPPYDTDPADVARAAGACLGPDGLLVLEHARRRILPAVIDGLTRRREVRAGDSALAFFAWTADAPTAGERER
jgi:16S rRNA (guanine966-N2)-methyltransferase